MIKTNNIRLIISAIFIFFLSIVLSTTTNDYDFNLNVTPSTRTINTGDSTHYQVTVQFKGSYVKPVNMSVTGLPAGTIGSFTVNPITHTGDGKTKLEIETSTATPCGTYTLTITGQEDGGGITHSEEVTLIIENCPDPDFTITVTPDSREIIQGESTDYTVTLTALNGFDSAVNLNITGLPAEASGIFSIDPVIPTGESILTISTTTSAPVGQYTLTVTGEGGGKTHSTQITLNINEKPPEPNFTIAVTPDSREIIQGESVDYTVTLTALNGFDSAVNLSITGLLAEASEVFSINPVTPTGESILTISTTTSTPAGEYTLTVKGEGGEKTHSTQITLKINEKPPESNFTIEAEPNTQTLYKGESTNYKIKLTSINGFSKLVKLTVEDELPTGITAVFQPKRVKPTGESELTITTSESTPADSYTLSILGKGGGKRHRVKITFTVKELPPKPEFTIKAEPGTRSLYRGESTDYTITITAINEFSAEISLNVTGVPGGTTAAFTTETISGAGTSQLQVTTSADTPLGNHPLAITAKSGEIEHSAAVKLSVVCRDFSVKIKAEPEKGAAPLTVGFEAEVTNNDGYSAADYHYLWNFGDGNTSSKQSPGHTFQAPGNYQVKLTVTDSCGNSKTAAKTIDVEGFEGAISKSFSVSKALPGDEVFFTIEARNDTHFDFTNIIIRDELSPMLEYLEDDAAVTPRRSGQEIVWQFPGFSKGETLRLKVKVKVSENAPQGIITNVARLSHDSLGPGKRITSNTASLTVNKIVVTLHKQVEKTSAQPDDTINYQLTVKNNSAVPLTGIKLTDELSSHLEFVSQAGNLEFSQQGQYLKWTGTIDAQQQVVVVFKARVNHDTFSGTRIQNQARLEALELKAPLDSNIVETFISSEPISTTNVRFTKRSEVPQTEVGRIIRFNITVANMSDSTLISPVIEDYLPQGFSYVASSTLLNNQRFADPQGNRRLLWQLPHIRPGETVVLRYQVVIGTDARRGRNINRATLRTTDNSGQDIFLEASAFVNVSAAGFIFYSGVEGTVYLNRDDDEFYSMMDKPLEGIEVRMSIGEKAITNALGQYRFENLFPGEYAVGINSATLPEKYRVFSQSPQVVVLMDGFTDTVDFAVKYDDKEDPTDAWLEGRVFFDKNQNQVYDSVDHLCETFKARLGDQLVTNGSNGTFVFTNLEPGNYTIEISYNEGFKKIKKEITINKGKNHIDIPLKFSGITVIIKGEGQ